MRRPLTQRERLQVRVNMLASEALRPVHVHRISLVEGTLRGLSRYHCDGPGEGHDCLDRDARGYHTYAHTNHDRMRT